MTKQGQGNTVSLHQGRLLGRQELCKHPVSMLGMYAASCDCERQSLLLGPMQASLLVVERLVLDSCTPVVFLCCRSRSSLAAPIDEFPVPCIWLQEHTSTWTPRSLLLALVLDGRAATNPHADAKPKPVTSQPLFRLLMYQYNPVTQTLTSA
jgi:hypothetical protein